MADLNLREMLKDKGSVAMLGTALIAPEFILVCIAGVMAYQRWKMNARLRAESIVRKLEHVAVSYYGGTIKLYKYNSDPTINFDERIIEGIRTSVRELSDKDLKFISSIPKEIFELEKDIHRAIMDEVIERSIINA